MQNLAILTRVLDLNHTIHLCIERVVFARTYIVSRVELGATLTNEDVAGLYDFT